MTLNEYLPKIEQFLKEYLQNSHTSGYVLGLSGGVDSSLCAVLAKKAVGREKLTCLLIPIHSHPDDLKDALELAKSFDLQYILFNGDSMFDAAMDNFSKLGISLDRSTQANLKVRIRMCILYAYAQKINGLVIGTDNMDERYTGYFTKYGDGACDVLPIVHLTKGEVVEASKILGIPQHLAERVPTAGLFEGQTDEGEMGIKYADLDKFLLGSQIDEKTQERIEHLHRVSEHKRIPIPTPEEFIR